MVCLDCVTSKAQIKHGAHHKMLGSADQRAPNYTEMSKNLAKLKADMLEIYKIQGTDRTPDAKENILCSYKISPAV